MRAPRCERCTTSGLRRAGLRAAAVWVAGAVLVTLAVPVAADDDYSDRIGVTLGAGMAQYVGGELGHADLAGIYHFGLRFGYRRHFDVETSLRYHSFLAVEVPDDAKFRNQSTQLDMSVLFNSRPDASWTPQAWVGAGAMFWQVVDHSNLASSGLLDDGPTARGYKSDGDPRILTDTHFTVAGGLGAEFQITRLASLRVGARIDWMILNETDNTGASAAFDDTLTNRAHVDANVFLPSAFVGLTWFFTQRDADQDGLPNRDDPCRYEAEDMDGYEDGNGCPDPDNDGDGILDAVDTCPDQAEDRDTFEDEDGCPEGDNDKDGVSDADDKCPTEAEDADGFQDTDGCPDGDNDGDGIPDTADTCKDTPAGVKVNPQGCPTALRIETETPVAGLRFARNSEEIQAGYAALDSIAACLTAYPDITVEIEGHTSSVGSTENNMLLSQRRAEAVARYLGERGVASSRMMPIGYGEDRPIAPNETEPGRMQNERVVIVPTKVELPDVAPK